MNLEVIHQFLIQSAGHLNLFVTTHENVQHLLTHYGNYALFGLLALGIFGLPIPDETLLIIAGYLMAKGHLSYITPFIAFGGSVLGITMSYVLGYTAGKRIVFKYGKWVGVTPKKLARAHSWFDWIGKWMLLIGFFIPGVRHLTGFIAGTVYLDYWKFAVLAYTGAFIWSMTFITIGYFFFKEWHHHFLHSV